MRLKETDSHETKTVILFAALALLIPAVAARAGLGQLLQFYTVRPGDTLARIARTYGTSWSYLASINGISQPEPDLLGHDDLRAGLQPAAADT